MVGKSHGHGQNIMGVPVTVAMGNAYYVFFVPMVIATGMPMPTVMGMPVTMCTGTSTIGKHASWMVQQHVKGVNVVCLHCFVQH